MQDKTYSMDMHEKQQLLDNPTEEVKNQNREGGRRMLQVLFLQFLLIVFAAVFLLTRVYPLHSTSTNQDLIAYSLDQCRGLSPEELDNRAVCCADPTLPVVGGIDVVELFSQPAHTLPKIGSSIYTSTLQTSTGTYIFRFLSDENRDKFNEDPWKYAPAYGGFCACGIALEERFSNPDFKYKLGPYVDLSKWDIVEDRLYFFSGPSPCNYFKSEVETGGAIAKGDDHWAAFYDGQLHDGVFNTNCFHRQEYEDLINGIQSQFVCPDNIIASCGC